jgi:hypothetical protein
MPIFPALALLLSCNGTDTGTSVDSGTTLPVETACSDAADLLGYTPCVHVVDTDQTFTDITLNSSSIDQLRVGKYLAPAVDDARLPTAWLNVQVFSLHYEFLITAFPDIFSGLTTSAYNDLVLYPDTREFYAGTVAVYLSADGGDPFYGFSVWDDPADSSTTVTQADVTAAWESLQARFDVGELFFVPGTGNQETAASSWRDVPFGIAGLADVPYEVYNPGEAYGTLRLYTLAELSAASESAEFGYQDILVVEEAPQDLERVVSGIVTGTRQGDLSHLNVLSANRGTPNCYLQDPLEALADWEGQLVRFECGDTDYSVEAAEQADAEAWWESIRPNPVEVCVPDISVTALPGLLDLDTDSAQARADGVCAYGSKGTNLAALYQRIDNAYAFTGFTVPVHYYDAFVNTGVWIVDLGDGDAIHTFQETLDAWHADPAFLSDASYRRERLEDLRTEMLGTPVDPDLITLLAERITDTWGNDTTMVRFRSSSNAEDSLEFNGAGLYESESVCLADELDGDDVGPSLCDPDKSSEKTLTEGLQSVWSSLWNMGAWEERDWYGIDQSKVAMGVLCNDRSKDEQANIVAFTGNPTSAGDDRFLINAQEGELEVVAAEAGVYPESILLTLADGEVTEIFRVSPSSEVTEVLTDAEVTELGEVLDDVRDVYPIDLEVPEENDLLWDTEWKITSEGRLVIKQIRPYIR